MWIVRHFVVKDAAPTKALPGMALRHHRHDSSNHGEDLTEQAAVDLQQQKRQEQHSSPSLPPAPVPVPPATPPQQQFREQNHAAAIEAEQRERLKQRFGAHDGL